MDTDEQKPVDAETMRVLKHDIKNQLSGMILCLEQLRFELTDPQPDWTYYIDAIGNGCAEIDKLLGEV
jgi:hypothetical protein